MVGRGGVRAPAPGVRKGLPLRAGGDGGARDPGLVLALVGQEGAAVDVPDGVEPVGAADPEAVVDVQPGAGLQADRLQADVLGARGPAGREEHLVGLDAVAALQEHRDRSAAPVPYHRRDGRALADVRAALLQGPGDVLADEGLHAGEQAPAPYEHGHLRAEGLPGGGHLRAHHSPAHHGEPFGHVPGGGRLAAGPGAGPGQSGQLRQDGAAAGADGDRVPGGEHVPLALGAHDLDPARPGQAAVAAQDPDTDRVQPVELAVVLPVADDLVPVGEDRRRGQGAADRLAQSGERAGVGAGDPGAEERLAGHAGPVRALAADQLALDDRRTQTGRPHPVGDVLADRSRAQYHHVVDLLVFHRMCHDPSLRAGAWNSAARYAVVPGESPGDREDTTRRPRKAGRRATRSRPACGAWTETRTRRALPRTLRGTGAPLRPQPKQHAY